MCEDSYLAPARFRRTPQERADQGLSWARPDQAFFAAGACHILAWQFLARHQESGFEIIGIRSPGERQPGHYYVSDGEWAFDHCGWTREQALLTETRRAEAVGTLHRESVHLTLDELCASYWMRPPDAFDH